eukprot:TRINITY_DN75707_c0_g1_i1.p1 TRINITY_DN75707_c0_g1~~TRINITY_DN75707_c0_g1_i1.p1  ORF type:complete len:218 (+),score=27.80 TRINITY_DN75707_c0_g1_i1:131-784(+)
MDDAVQQRRERKRNVRVAHLTDHRRHQKPPEAARPQLYVFGEVEGAVPCWPLVRLYCSWRLLFDASSWLVIQGETEGETFSSEVGSNGLCVWNHPVMAHFACKALRGWPRLEFEVRGCDSHGRNQLVGYGSYALPATAGSSEVLCRCWRPSGGSSLLARLRARLLGVWPELQRPDTISDCGQGAGTNRDGLWTEDSVDIFLRLNIVQQHFQENGLVA